MEISKKIGMRLLCFLVSLLCLLLLVQPAAAEQADVQSVGACTAKIYCYPSEQSMVIGQVLHGQPIQVLGQSGEYFKVDCFGMNGYISKNQILCNAQGECYVNCEPPSAVSDLFFRYRPETAETMREAVAEMGQKYLGVPYVYGGVSPSGFDCSGFTYYVFAKQGIILQRCADEQLGDGLIIAREDLQPGDLVFFTTYGPWIASHVGVYIGDGKMLQAGSGGITCSSLDAPYWAERYVGARRVIDITNAEPMAEDSLSNVFGPEKSCNPVIKMVR